MNIFYSIRERAHLVAGALVIAVSVPVLFGWLTHNNLAQLQASYAPMQFNTALGFVICGVTLFLLETKRRRHVIWPGGLLAIFGAVTLLEYLADWDLGIDGLFYKSAVTSGVSHPDRVAPLTAVCFVLIGMAIVFAGRAERSQRLFLVTSLSSAMVTIVAAVVIGGHVMSAEPAYGWGRNAKMALQTAVLFLCVSGALLGWSGSRVARGSVKFVSWVPVTASLTLIAMVGLILAASFDELKRATEWRTHSYEVLSSAETLVGNLFDTQRGMRAYILTGDAAGLETARVGRMEAQAQLGKIAALVGENAAQVERLHRIEKDFESLAQYSDKLIALYQQKGRQAAIEVEATGAGFSLITQTRADLDFFIREEYRLLEARSTIAAGRTEGTGHLLVFSGVILVALILLANGTAHREIRRRVRAEEELKSVAGMQRAILDSANYAIISTMPDGVVSTFNSTAERWLGYSADEIIGRQTPALWHIDAEVQARAAALSTELSRIIEPGFAVFTEKAQLGKADETEWTLRRKDGSQFPASLSVTPIMETRGNIVGYLGVLSDITERKNAEKKLRDQALILDLANDSIFIRDLDDRISYWNQGAQRLYGWSKHEAIGKVTHDLLRTQFPASLAKITRSLRETGRWEGELIQMRRDGSLVTVASSWTLQVDEVGNALSVIELNDDISARKKVQSELARSTARLNAVLESSLDGIVVCDALRDKEGAVQDFRYVMVNPAAERLMGMTSSELIGHTMLTKFPNVMQDGLFGKFVEIVTENSTMDMEHCSLRRGARRWYRIAGVRLGDGLVLSYAEITPRKQAEEALNTYARRMDLATQALNAGVWDWEVGTDKLYWDETVRRLFDLGEDEEAGHEVWASKVVPEDLARIDGQLREILRTKSQFSGEYRIRRPGGEIRHIQAAAAAVMDDRGEVERVVGINLDVTARKENEEALRLSEGKFSSAFEHATTGMALISLEGQWMKVNQAICDLLGYTAEELTQKTFQDITHADDLHSDLAHVRRLIAGKEDFYKMEKRYIHKDGHMVWTLLGVSLLRDDQGRPLYFISQVEDISQIKHALMRQEELTKTAQAAERAKSEFLAIMSHEIRTPMNGVIGMTSVLADTALDDEQRECLSTIQTSGESLLAVINDILDYSKIEAGRFQIESRPFHLEQCVEESVDLFAAQIRMKRLEAGYVVDPKIPAHLLGDSLRLRQILTNLIGNAIKFTTNGEITINVSLRAIDGSGCHLEFSVADTGIGISKDGISQLFQAFQQVDTSNTRRYGGTGLGLVISKRLTEYMGGDMWVTSEEGKGSTFYFTAVLKVSEEISADGRTHDSTALESRSVLLVDDNDTNRRILEAQLKIWGMKTVSTANGREALEKMGEGRYDLVLLDYQMPGMNGVELAKMLRGQSSTPMILLSSSGETVVGSDADLFHHQIVKPIKHSQLFNAILKVIGVGGKTSKPSVGTQFDSGLAVRHPLTILLAEDNVTNQKVVSLMLSRLGYTAEVAADGREAVAISEGKCFDVILMDVQMPEMNGIEAMRIIRARRGKCSPMVIALTAEALEGDEARLRSEGFDGYLSKPLQVAMLQNVLAGIKRRET